MWCFPQMKVNYWTYGSLGVGKSQHFLVKYLVHNWYSCLDKGHIFDNFTCDTQYFFFLLPASLVVEMIEGRNFFLDISRVRYSSAHNENFMLCLHLLKKMMFCRETHIWSLASSEALFLSSASALAASCCHSNSHRRSLSASKAFLSSATWGEEKYFNRHTCTLRIGWTIYFA